MNVPRIAVVGGCASGKTSVVACLRERGYDAYAVSQEHSIVSGLWQHQDPDRVVYLDVRLETVRARRADPNWPQWIYDLQRSRLVSAREHADVVISTDDCTVNESVELILARLNFPRRSN